MKRTFDLVVASAGLVLVSPLLLAIALAVKLDSPGTVLYRGTRVGKDGDLYEILKFRTMIENAAEHGASITTRNDARVTHVGAWLRRTKLDELPQLWNVVRGEMSLVGPRPEDPRYLKYYSPAQRTLLRVRPGITSAASVAFRNEQEILDGTDWERKYIEVILPEKLNLDLAYMEKQSFADDLVILAQTFLAVGKGGYSHRVSELDH